MPFTTSEIDALFDPILTVDAIYTPSGGTAKTIKVVFESEYLSVQVVGDVGVESASPAAYCKSADIIGVQHGDTLAISGTTYNIIGIQPDGTGMTTLILSKD